LLKKLVVLFFSFIMLVGCSPRIEAPKPDRESVIDLLRTNALAVDSIQGVGRLRIDYRGEFISIPFTMSLSSARYLRIDANVGGSSFLPVGRILVESDSSMTLISTPLGFLDLSQSPLDENQIHLCLISIFAGLDLILPLVRDSGFGLGSEIRLDRMRLKPDIDPGLLRVKSWEASLPEEITVRARVLSFDGKTNRPLSTFAVIYPHEIALRVKYDSLFVRIRNRS
jgi:hypothetical protein